MDNYKPLTPEAKRAIAEAMLVDQQVHTPPRELTSKEKLRALEQTVSRLVLEMSDVKRTLLEIENPELLKRRLDFEAREAEKYLPKKFQTV